MASISDFLPVTSVTSWKNRRRNGGGRRRRRSGGSSPLLQPRLLPRLQGTWWTARPVTPQGTGESKECFWGKQRGEVQAEQSHPRTQSSLPHVTFHSSRSHSRLPASTLPASVNGVCTDSETPQVSPTDPVPGVILNPYNPLTASCPCSPSWNSRDLSRAASPKGL